MCVRMRACLCACVYVCACGPGPVHCKCKRPAHVRNIPQAREERQQICREPPSLTYRFPVLSVPATRMCPFALCQEPGYTCSSSSTHNIQHQSPPVCWSIGHRSNGRRPRLLSPPSPSLSLSLSPFLSFSLSDAREHSSFGSSECRYYPVTFIVESAVGHVRVQHAAARGNLISVKIMVEVSGLKSV